MRKLSALPTTAIATLALGIGLSTAVFTVAEALLLRPLPVADEDRLAVLWGESPDGKFSNVPLTLPELQQFEQRTRAIDRIAYHTFRGATPAAFRAELGIRLALGATAGDVRRLVLGRGLLIATVGIAAGVVAARAVSAVMAGLLFGISANDAPTSSGVVAVVFLVALLASLVPARVGASVDPVRVLRVDA